MWRIHNVPVECTFCNFRSYSGPRAFHLYLSLWADLFLISSHPFTHKLITPTHDPPPTYHDTPYPPAKKKQHIPPEIPKDEINKTKKLENHNINKRPNNKLKNIWKINKAPQRLFAGSNHLEIIMDRCRSHC